MRPRPGIGGQLALQFHVQAADFLQVLAGQHELQRLAPLALDHRIGGGKDPGAGNLAELLAQQGSTSCCFTLRSCAAPCGRRPCPG
jgi:hypothetical protein